MAYTAWSVVFGEQPSAAKWNILGANDASFNDGTGIAVSAITPEKLLTGTGTSWPWSTWTPTWVNFTPGSATIMAKYKQVGKAVTFRLIVTLSSSTMGTAPTFTLPVTAASGYPVGTAAAGSYIASGAIRDAGTDSFNCYVNLDSTTIGALLYWNTNNNPGTPTSTLPMTWANGDYFTLEGTYEAA